MSRKHSKWNNPSYRQDQSHNRKHSSFFKTIQWQIIAFCLLLFVIFSFSSIFSQNLKVDHYTYNFLFGSVAKYIFYFFSGWFLILEIFRRTAHPIINRKIISLVLLTISITIFIAIRQLMDVSQPYQTFNKFIDDWENYQTLSSGALQTLYVAFFMLIPPHWLALTLALLVNIIFFLIILSILLTNHAYYLYYWCITYLIYLRKKRVIYRKTIAKYQHELLDKQKQIYLERQKKLSSSPILKDEDISVEAKPVNFHTPSFSQNKPQPSVSYSRSPKSSTSWEEIDLDEVILNSRPNTLQQKSRETDEIWKKAHTHLSPADENLKNEKLEIHTNEIIKKSLSSLSDDDILPISVSTSLLNKAKTASENIDVENKSTDLATEEFNVFGLSEEIKDHNKKLFDETKTIVTETIEKEMPKPEKLSFFQSLKTDELSRKKVFSLPQKIKAKKAQIRSAVFGDDIALTPYKRMTTEEVIENQQKNETLNDEDFHIKDLTQSQFSSTPDTKTQESEKVSKLDTLIQKYPHIGFFSYDLGNYKFPRLDLLKVIKNQFPRIEKDEFVNQKKQVIVNTFKAFNIDVLNIDSHIASSIIQYRLRLPENVNLNRVLQIQNNLKLGLAAKSLRIQAPIPGFSLVGIETESPWKELISLKNLIEEQILTNNQSLLTIPIGRNINGKCQTLNIEKLPHLLVAGATGTGKSVCLNSILIALLMTNSPNDLRIVLIDPKKVEMTAYQNLPHLLFPVIKTIEKAKIAFVKLLKIMDDRYHFLSQAGYKKIYDYNKSRKDPNLKLSYIVVLIDELADLMLTSGKIFENYILRIAQLGRAAGIHLILSTQRPSVNIITGVIKANIVARISFQVGSSIDSKIIIDQGGAENLLGNGDMLYLSPSIPHPIRIQGPFITDGEINSITRFIISQQHPRFLELESPNDPSSKTGQNQQFNDDLYPEIKSWVENELTQISSSFLQRKYRIGFNRAASIIDQLEKDKVIGPQEGSKPRKVLK